jgi:serine/threonine protein kinase
MKRTVAIKFLLKSLTESEDLIVRFEREVEAAARLDHQNIVTAYDACVHDGNHFLVMQYIDGDDLSDIVKAQGPLEVSIAIDVIRQTACGLAYAHDREIVHRDIKPANLLLDGEGVVRILDMGLARIKPTPGDDNVDALTNSGSMMGTVDYMAPEQAMDAKSVDHRADIYSLGCTLFFLLVGRAPFGFDSMMSRLLAHREREVPRLISNRYGVPSELEAIFQKMMAKNPDDRFQTMTELVTGLDAIDPSNEVDAASTATLDMPDDGSGGFIQVTDDDDSEIPQSKQTFVTPNRPVPEPRPVTVSPKPVVQPKAIDATMVESAATAGSANRFLADNKQVADTVLPTVFDTFAESAPQSAASITKRAVTRSASRNRAVAIGIGLLAMIVVWGLAFLGDSETKKVRDQARPHPGLERNRSSERNGSL